MDTKFTSYYLRVTFLCLSLVFQSYAQNFNDYFVTRWNMNIPAPTTDQIEFFIQNPNGPVNYRWRELPSGTYTTGSFSTNANLTQVTLSSLPAGNVTIELWLEPTNLQRFAINNNSYKNRLTRVVQWGTTQWRSFENMFTGCSNLRISALDAPNLSLCTSMKEAFLGCSQINDTTIVNINNWDVSNVSNMSRLFRQSNFNQPIGNWNVSNVTDMSYMFYDAQQFNQDIGSWDVSNVTDMSSMFYNAQSFNNGNNINPINNWNVSKVKTMNSMFRIAIAFNRNIGSWNVSNVTDMSYMFFYAGQFDQNIGSWNVSNVADMKYMFYYATNFNGNIGSWDVSKVTDMSYMFYNATNFNQNIGNWNVSKVTDMSSMFYYAQNFNNGNNSNPINNWDVSNVKNMNSMFSSATSFNRNIGGWNVSSVEDMGRMFEYASAFTNINLNSWNVSNVKDMQWMFAYSNFNGDITGWNVSKVIDMSGMFAFNNAFNQNIGNWNVSNVKNMSYMFSNNIAFNQDISNWNVRNVTDMSYMFAGATAFNRSLGLWTLNPDVDLTDALNGSGINCFNYSTTLILWAATTTATGRTLDATGLYYGNDAITTAARTKLISAPYYWTITGDLQNNTTCDPPIFYSKSSGFLNDLSTWGTNPDGTGTSPTSFTAEPQYFIITNRSTADINGNWNVFANLNVVILGDGNAAITFNTGTYTFNGTIKLTANSSMVIGSNITSNFRLIAENNSTLEYSVNNAAQTIWTPASGFSVFNLTISGNRGNNSINMSNTIFNIRNNFNITATNVSSWTVSNSTINYCGNGDQTIITGNTSGFVYNNLYITGERDDNSTLTLASGTITIRGNALFGATGTNIIWSNTGNTVDYNHQGDQQIAGFQYNNLTISGNRQFTPTITFEPHQEIRISNSFNITISTTHGIIWRNAHSTFIYNGDNTQTITTTNIGNFSYNNLEISGTSGTKTLGGNVTVDGTLTLDRSLHIGANTLTLNGGFYRLIPNVLVCDGTSSNLVISGSGSIGNLFFDQTTPGVTNRLNNLTINRPSQTITLGNALQVRGTLTPTAGTLNTGTNLLTLVSDASGTARVAQGPTVGNYLIGSAIVQRYIPAPTNPGPSNNYGRRWRLVSSPIDGSTVDDWRQETFITGPGTGNTVGQQNSNGFDATANNSPSLFSYNEATLGTSDLGWTSPADVNVTLATGRGYRIFIRGDRTDLNRITIPYSTTTPANDVTLDVRGGTVHQGNITMPVTYTTSSAGDNHDGWNLLGNPYPCPIDWNTIHDAGRSGGPTYYSGTNYANLMPTAWIWNPSTNSYDTYNALSNTGTGSGDFATTGVIASGQAFWVKAGTSPSLTITESHKASTNVTGLFKNTGSFKLELMLDSFNRDEMAVKYLNGSQPTFDGYDAQKLATAVGIAAWDNDNIDLTISCRPPVTNVNDTIRLNVTVPASGNYTMIFKNSQELAIQQYVSLIDVYTNTVTDMLSQNSYTFTANMSQPLSYGKNRFYIVISQNQPLPVEVLKLKARAISKQQVEVSWESASEVNFSHYEVEKSTDGSSYTAITKVNGIGATQYLAYDNAPEALNYYRLKLVDKDGTYRHTHSVVVRMEDANAAQPVVYPNPAPGFFTVNVPQPANYEIVDLNGRTVATGHITKEHFFDDLNSGVYMMKLRYDNGKEESLKIVVGGIK